MRPAGASAQPRLLLLLLLPLRPVDCAGGKLARGFSELLLCGRGVKLSPGAAAEAVGCLALGATPRGQVIGMIDCTVSQRGVALRPRLLPRGHSLGPRHTRTGSRSHSGCVAPAECALLAKARYLCTTRLRPQPERLVHADKTDRSVWAPHLGWEVLRRRTVGPLSPFGNSHKFSMSYILIAVGTGWERDCGRGKKICCRMMHVPCQTLADGKTPHPVLQPPAGHNSNFKAQLTFSLRCCSVIPERRRPSGARR